MLMKKSVASAINPITFKIQICKFWVLANFDLVLGSIILDHISELHFFILNVSTFSSIQSFPLLIWL